MQPPDFASLPWRVMFEPMVRTEAIGECFAYEDELIAQVGAGELPPLLRFWRHERALVLGYQDTRLPAWEAAASAMGQAGYTVGVRTSGGQAVPLDPGVLNLSLIYPDPGRHVDAGFAAMHRVLATALAPYGLHVERGKIVGGYCPGESDLAVAGRKVAGVAQRWRRGAGSVGAFLLVDGSGMARAEIARQFYAQAGGTVGTPGHLTVQPQVMAALAELLPLPSPDVEEVARRIEAAVRAGFCPG